MMKKKTRLEDAQSGPEEGDNGLKSTEA